MSKVVFVGNIPYDFTETQVVDIFSTVGQVVNFRLVFDRDTGKAKGYGFCTFHDHETAASAVRNLNHYDVGGRQLRVDFADHDSNNNTPSTMPAATVPQIMSSMQPHQLVELLGQLKYSCQNNLQATRLLLLENPQLVLAVFQALLGMNMVDQYTMQRILATQSQTPVPVVDQQQLLQEQQQQLLMQLLQLTPEQIQALPKEQQDQIMLLQQQVLNK